MRRKIPSEKNVKSVFELGSRLIGNFIFFIQLNDDNNSAEPNTAGITVEKLNVARAAYSMSLKCSFPTYANCANKN